ncbi:hypothetical protein IHV10_13415 [Fictibacillus sp. 5RED26]|uniref:hypothetical protein n=1 Tax=Fictibacillus sp. 5RED26 TaxID=2745876 RepID=UPI0018CCB801|nr:hypothetical protein [Fictibacillus sp. 5RED26]MBH0157372.1 hypothetical protein [Fictibacillus sp. 5RED26]
MAFVIASGILVFLVFLAIRLTKGKTTKRKLIVWGSFIMVGINPFLTFLISIPVGVAVGDGFAAVGMMMLLLPAFFVIGLITLLAGVFTTNKVEDA